MPMAAIVARLRAAYAAELAKYARHHRSRANLWLHAVLAPVEWAACLVALRCAARGAAVHAAQLAVVAGAACARPAVALPQLVLSPLACAGAANASNVKEARKATPGWFWERAACDNATEWMAWRLRGGFVHGHRRRPHHHSPP